MDWYMTWYDQEAQIFFADSDFQIILKEQLLFQIF